MKNGKLKNFLKNSAAPVAKEILKDTKVGKVFGVVENLIKGEPISEEEKNILRQEAYEHDLEMAKVEAEDRQSARNRQTIMAQLGKFDLLYYVTGLGGIAAFMFVIYALTFLKIPEENQKLFIHLVGIIEGVVVTIFAFFFGGNRKER